MIPATPRDDAYNASMTLPHYTRTRKHPVPPVAREEAIKEMKAVAVFPRTREIKVIEHQAPQLTLPDQAKLRILDVRVCGTDKEICAFAYGTPPPDSDYLVIGHESLAEVIEKALWIWQQRFSQLPVLCPLVDNCEQDNADHTERYGCH